MKEAARAKQPAFLSLSPPGLTLDFEAGQGKQRKPKQAASVPKTVPVFFPPFCLFHGLPGLFWVTAVLCLND